MTLPFNPGGDSGDTGDESGEGSGFSVPESSVPGNEGNVS